MRRSGGTRRSSRRTSMASVSRPGETFSVWRLAPRPTAARGYAVAAALKDRRLTSDVGGAICLLSTVLYNAGILTGLEVHRAPLP